MNKAELVAAVAEKTGYEKKPTAEIVNAIIQVLSEQLVAKEAVQLIGFGTFKTAERAARVGKNPTNGEPLNIPAAIVPKFIPGKALKEAVNVKPKKSCKKK